VSESAGYYLTVKITPDPGFTLDLDAMIATEELGRPFLFELELSSAKPKGDLKAQLGSSVTVTAQQQGGTTRYYNGIVARVIYIGLSGGAYRYRVELRPWIWLLSQTRDCAIFQNKSAFSIITDGIFRAKGFSNFQDKRQSQSGDTTLEYCVQYRETALDFVTRLMEQWGIYYYFQHSDGQHTLVLADDPNSHTALSKAIPYLLNQAEYRGVEDHIWDWAADLNLQSGAYTMRDYNFTIPAADLTGKLVNAGGHPNDSLEVYDYPAWYATKSTGQSLAAIRMQDLAARRQVVSGVSNARGLYAGCKFTLSDFAETAMNREYLVIAATTSFTVAEGLADTGGNLTDTYRCLFQAIPGDVVFRLPPVTPRPAVQGPQTAKVVGASGDEITTDGYGRIKVKFYWDRSPGTDENSSCWIRVSQLWAGANWGAMFIPRVGQEVIVDFIEGNPDRPIVTGRVYNATQGVPYPLPGNATRSTIMSNSSKGGGGSNELRFDDKAGSEEVFFHAQKDYHRVVLNNENIDITNDSTTTVSQGKRSVTVSAKDNVLTVSQGNNTATVSTGHDSLTVSTGNHSITVSAGASSVTAGKSITLTVGANSITIDTSGVTISAAKISVTSTGPTAINANGPAALQSSAEVTIAGKTVLIN
jgi:type VI secretion system secreted protein VgrG